MSWFGELSPSGKRTFYASFLGWTIDALDYMVFTFVISTLVTLWGIDRGQAGMLGTVTLLFSAIGGWGAASTSSFIQCCRAYACTSIPRCR